MNGPTITDYRNPVYVSEDMNLIDLEIDTQEYGWIPTTVIMDDGDEAEHVVQIKAWLMNNTASIAAYVAPPPPPVEIPQAVTPRQARLQLVVLNKLDQVLQAIAAMPSPDRELAEIEWEYATFYDRNNPLIIQLGATLQIDLDQFFLDASTL